jgi:hypothetical protein
MGKGIGELQRALLAAIQERGCIDTLEAARDAYKLGPRAAVSDAQHAATRRALAGLAKRGLVVHLEHLTRRLNRLWVHMTARIGFNIPTGTKGPVMNGEALF